MPLPSPETSQAFLRAALRAALDAIVGMDHEGNVIEFSSAAEEIFGYSRQEALGKPLAELIIPPSARERHRSALSRYLETGARTILGERVEMTAIRSDGAEFPVELTVTRLELDGPARFMAVIRDITERRQREEALAASQARYQDLFDNAPDMFVSVDALSAKIIECNHTAARALGYTKEELLGRDLFNVYHPDSLDGARRAFRAFVETGEVRDAQLQLQRKDGSKIDVTLNVSAVRDESGRLVRSRSVWRDVSEQRRAEEALQASERRLRRLLETTQVVPWEGNAETLEFTYVGPQAVTLLGYPVKDWYEPNFWPTRIHPEDREFAVDLCLKASRGGSDHEFEYRMVAADGRTVWVHDLVNVDSGSEPRTLRGFMIDVTARKRADEELARHRLRLEELVKARTTELERTHEELRRSERLASVGTFAAGIAHQINNPLGGILLAVRSAQDSSDDPAALGVALADVVSDAKRCGRIVRSLLRFAREGVFDKAPVDLNAIVRSAAGRLGDHGAEVELQLADALPPLSLNEDAIGEVIVNLLQNAVDAGADHIALQTRATRDSARLTVCDDGRGIGKRDLKRVFDPFFTQRPGKGTGLGLSIAHSLVAEHGGTIDLSSEPGSGTTVTVNLPVNAGGGGEGSHR